MDRIPRLTADYARMSLPIRGRDGERFIAARQRCARKHDRLQQIARGADFADLAEIRANRASLGANAVTSEARSLATDKNVPAARRISPLQRRLKFRDALRSGFFADGRTHQ